MAGGDGGWVGMGRTRVGDPGRIGTGIGLVGVFDAVGRYMGGTPVSSARSGTGIVSGLLTGLTSPSASCQLSALSSASGGG